MVALAAAYAGKGKKTEKHVPERPSLVTVRSRKPKITKLLADCERLPKGSAERLQTFRKLLKVLHDEYAK
jgi:hypothetical protein